MRKKNLEDKSLQELLADVSIRIRVYRATLQSKNEDVITGKPLTEHEMLLISLLGVLGGGSQRLNINDIHGIYRVISLASLSNTIKSLGENGLIEKKSPFGMRGNTLHLTETGKVKYKEILRNNAAAFEKVVAGFQMTEEDEKVMRRCYTNLVRYFDQEVLPQLAPVLDKLD